MAAGGTATPQDTYSALDSLMPATPAPGVQLDIRTDKPHAVMAAIREFRGAKAAKDDENRATVAGEEKSDEATMETIVEIPRPRYAALLKQLRELGTVEIRKPSAEARTADPHARDADRGSGAAGGTVRVHIRIQAKPTEVTPPSGRANGI
jgi:hypothetical protein